MHRSNHLHHFWDAFDPIASALSTFRGTTLIFPSDPIAAEAHTAFRRHRTGRAMVAAPNLIQHHGRGLAAKVTTLSATTTARTRLSAASIFKPVRSTPAPWNGGNGERVSYQSHDLTDPKAVSNPVEHAAFCNSFCLIGGLQ